MKLALAFFVIFASVAAHAEIGFKKGNRLTAVLTQGDILVQCSGSGGFPPGTGGPSSASFRCQEEVITTGEFDYFVGPERIQADAVTLTATHADGSTRTKKSGYDSAKGQSTDTFNLWIATLFQRPLLDVGLNKITYTLTYKGKTTSSGKFEATVKDGGRKVCQRRGSYWSPNASDCQNPSAMCSRYFSENNYCM